MTREEQQKTAFDLIEVAFNAIEARLKRMEERALVAEAECERLREAIQQAVWQTTSKGRTYCFSCLRGDHEPVYDPGCLCAVLGDEPKGKDNAD